MPRLKCPKETRTCWICQRSPVVGTSQGYVLLPHHTGVKFKDFCSFECLRKYTNMEYKERMRRAALIRHGKAQPL